MEWINFLGLVFISLIMVPNIVFAVRCKQGFENSYQSKAIETIEQIGRFGCFGFMIFNIPGIWFGWWSDEAFAAYLIINFILVAFYCIMWIICWNKNNLFRALVLSITPSVVFLFSGIMSRSILLIFSSLLFAPTHIFLSCKNAK